MANKKFNYRNIIVGIILGVTVINYLFILFNINKIK